MHGTHKNQLTLHTLPNSGLHQVNYAINSNPNTCTFQKSVPESTVVKSRSGKACYLDDSDDEEFEGYSFGDIETAERRCNKKLKRSQRELAKLESPNLVLEEEEEERNHGNGKSVYPRS